MDRSLSLLSTTEALTMADRHPDKQSSARERAHQVVVTEMPQPGTGKPDYADAFAVARTVTDGRSAERWARDGFERLHWTLRRPALLAHRWILGFHLGPWDSADHVFGWRVATSELDLLHLEARSRLFSGDMVWRLYDSRLVMTTFLRFEKRRTGSAIWTVVGNIHRGGAPHLLELAATAPSA
jgi:hypothetical protein